jgi:hypothetical protein
VDINSCRYRTLLHQKIDVQCAWVGTPRIANAIRIWRNIFISTPKVIRSIRQFGKPPNLRTSPLSCSMPLTAVRIMKQWCRFWRQRFPSRHSPLYGQRELYLWLVENFGISIVPTSLQSGYNLDVKLELTEISQRTTLKITWNTSNTNPILKSFLSVVNQFVELDLAL